MNDAFLYATPIDLNALPFDELVNATEATTEPGEPFNCAFTYQTLWYQFTPSTGAWLNVDTSGGTYPYSYFTVYRATTPAFNALTFVTCAVGTQGGVTFFAGPDSVSSTPTYYIQAQMPCCQVPGTIRVRVTAAPAPQPTANFYWYPGEPSVFDNIQFQDSSYDPGQIGFSTLEWDFGDGSTATGCCPQHHYSTDQDYNVQHTVTTHDGRSASVSRLISVRTHDVAITRFRVPNTGSPGQNKPIGVSVRNTRYPENVRVDLYRGTTGGGFGGFQQIGYLQLAVPVRMSGQPTEFNFSYTFTDEDALIGKVTFRAVANIVNSRDVVPADNEAISLPTRVASAAALAEETEEGEEALPSSLALLGVTTRGTELGVQLSMPSTARATLEVLDVGGRILARRELDGFGAGVQQTTLTLERRPAPGVYFVRLAQGAEFTVKKVALVP